MFFWHIEPNLVVVVDKARKHIVVHYAQAHKYQLKTLKQNQRVYIILSFRINFLENEKTYPMKTVIKTACLLSSVIFKMIKYMDIPFAHDVIIKYTFFLLIQVEIL